MKNVKKSSRHPMKGISVVISSVIMILISMTAIGIVLSIGLPAVEIFKESTQIAEAELNMIIIDNVIRQISSEGSGIIKTAFIQSSAGTYRVDANSGSLTYDIDLTSDTIPKGTIVREGNIVITSGSSASTSQNATHIILKNEILEIVFDRIGSESSFSPINTNALIKYVNMDTKSVKPSIFGIVIDGNMDTSSGIGYSKPLFEGEGLSNAGVLAHVKTSVPNIEYDILYTLPASSDFLLIEVRNVTGRKTSLVYTYFIGSSDSIKIGNLSSSSQGCYTNQNISQFFLCSHDSSSSKSSGIIWSGKDRDFISTCYKSDSPDYTFNMTGIGSFKGIVPMASVDCSAVGNRVDEISREGFPASPFGSYELRGESKLQMKLSYDKIKLEGSLRLGEGSHDICFKKTGQDGNRAIINIEEC